MANIKLHNAKISKNDEFYTQFHDIELEINAYLDYDPNVFRGKTVLLPCDDPESSNFTRFFVLKFKELGLKKLISTSYAHTSKHVSYSYQLSLFESEAEQFDESKTQTHGKIFELTGDTNHDGKIDVDDLDWRYLKGDGDFRSKEVTKLRDEADIIVTNPPFSLFDEFIKWCFQGHEKKLLVIGNQNAIHHKVIFPLIKTNRLWLGHGFKGNIGFFKSRYEDIAVASDHRAGFIRVSGVMWFTNLDHGRRHTPLSLMTMADNKKFSKHKEVKGKDYERYDNFDAIEVPYTDAIPSDYGGAMGVPITFLDKYCPEQFEILGVLNSSTEEEAGLPVLRTYNDFKEMRQDMTYTGASGQKNNGYPILRGKSARGNFMYNEATGEYCHCAYARIVIRKIKQED